MAKRKTRIRTVYKRVRSRSKKGFGSIQGILKKVALGVGGGTLAVAGLSMARQYGLNIPVPDNLVKMGGGYYFGGIEGLIGSMLIGGGLQAPGAAPATSAAPVPTVR